MRRDEIPLFDGQPRTCKLIAFPLVRRVGKVRDMAVKMLDKSTDRHAEYDRCQVTDALLKHLTKIGVAEPHRNEQTDAFWIAVEFEVARLTYRGQKPGGAA